MKGTYTYTNNLGRQKELGVSQLQNGIWSVICFDMTTGERCFFETYTNEEALKAYLNRLKENYKDFAKVA